jgi:phosphoglycolate phosphatase-like HAD superfamily hydrolase
MQRLILFDVDGTLISTGGRAGKALAEALQETFGVAVSIEGYRFSGKTDPQIVRELMAASHFDARVVQARLPEAYAAYLDRLGSFLTPGTVQVLPGVRDLLDDLQDRQDVVLGLLTGNIRAGAELKLQRAKLQSYFEIGAYGSDNEDRNQLVAVAREQAQKHWGKDFSGQDTVVLGDAEADIRCARAGGARAVAVATGGTSFDDLARLGPDAVLETLQSPWALQALLGDLHEPALRRRRDDRTGPRASGSR